MHDRYSANHVQYHICIVRYNESENGLHGKGGCNKKGQSSNSVSSIVRVTKKDGGILIYGDFKVTINQNLLNTTYPLLEAGNMLV